MTNLFLPWRNLNNKLKKKINSLCFDLELILFMTEDKKKVEAILFTTGKFLEIQDLANLAEIKDLDYLKGLLTELKDEYEKRVSSLEIINEKTKNKKDGEQKK